jgi:hypothetical protein
MSHVSADATAICRLIGVYNAEGTLRGELAYWVGARLGRAHCALCDITHGLARERSDWKQLRDAMSVPFDTFHRNDQPDEAREVSDGLAPVVVAETAGGGLLVLLGPEELEACAGSTERLTSAIEAARAKAGLHWP